MEIAILCENTSSDVGCLAEWGFSTYITFEGTRTLFDMGYSDVYVQNGKKLGIDWGQTDSIVFSHFHNDHTRGLKFHPFQSKKTVVCHPDVLNKVPAEERLILTQDFELRPSKKWVEYSPNLFFLGEIPRTTPFEGGGFEDDQMKDDSAIAIKTEKGVVVISGCSHAGICNICEYAKQVTGLPLYGVIGGFHLFEEDRETIESTLAYFQREKPPHLYPMHCVDFPTLAKFHTLFNCKKYAAGDLISIS